MLFLQAEDGIRDIGVTGVQTCALPILNREFHMLLYQHAGQPRSLAIVANLLQECDRHTRLQLALTDGRARAEAEHDELLRLCVEGEIDAACKLLKTHIEGAGTSLLKYIHEHQKDSRSEEHTSELQSRQ